MCRRRVLVAGKKTYKTGLNGSTKTFYLTALVGGERWKYDRKDIRKRRSGPHVRLVFKSQEMACTSAVENTEVPCGPGSVF